MHSFQHTTSAELAIEPHGLSLDPNKHCHFYNLPTHNHTFEINLSPIYLFTQWFIKPIDRWWDRKMLMGLSKSLEEKFLEEVKRNPPIKRR